MTIIIFFIILSVLVFVHELGHFLAAKAAGVKVDEFGFGYPPRMFRLFSKWGTVFSVNWIPFGGFVKIAGESYDASSSEETNFNIPKEKKFTDVNKKWQVIILIAGVSFNLIFGWLLLSTTFMLGVPYSPSDKFGALVENPELMITSVLPDSPAYEAGLKAGDIIEGINKNDIELKSLAPQDASDFINSPESLEIDVLRVGEKLEIEVQPEQGLVPDRFALGISMDTVGTLQLGIMQSLIEGAKNTYYMFIGIVQGLISLIYGAFTGTADLSQVAGPVGIVSLVGEASKLGFIYLATFTVMISINLAVVNLIPFPALDGGRILFVIIEYIKGSRIKPKVFNTLNTIGFFLLISLMLVITWNDIARLF